jgi:purine-binding chemotaxis protein CheW
MNENNSQSDKKSYADKTVKLVTFVLANEMYGIDIMQSQEIIKMQPMTPIPNSLDFVEGVINLRGKVIPIINLKKRFHLLSSYEGDKGIIIVKLQDTTVGITIDRIAKVIDIPAGNILPPPSVVAGIGREYITGVARADDEKLIILLDIDKLLSYEEKQELENVSPV